MKREEISQQYKWKMEDLYATNEAWEADFEKLQKGIEELQKFEGTLGESVENLLKMLLNLLRLLHFCVVRIHEVPLFRIHLQLRQPTDRPYR